MQKIITVELPKLKESMGVTINEGYFKKEQEDAQAKMKVLREEQQKRKAAKSIKEKNTHKTNISKLDILSVAGINPNSFETILLLQSLVFNLLFLTSWGVK